MGDQWGGGGDLLEVVEHQQQVAVAQGVDQAFDEGAVARLADAECLGDDRRDEVGVGQRRQVDEGDTVGEHAADLRGDAQRQPGFAHPARPGQGDQAHRGPAEQGDDQRHLALPPDEGGERRGQRRAEAVPIRDRGQRHGSGAGPVGGCRIGHGRDLHVACVART